MARKYLLAAFGMMLAASPVAATQPELVPAVAPAGAPDTKYCMRVEPVTGTRIETVQCWTRQEWAEEGVDVDEDWAKEGVAVLA